MTLNKKTSTQQIKGMCMGFTDKVLFLKSELGNQASLPISQIDIIDGQIAKGQTLTLNVPKWLLREQLTQRLPDVYDPKTPTLIKGIVVNTRDKAICVKCDADMMPRWLALSQIKIEEGGTALGKPVRLIAPAWMFRYASGSYPSWVRGAAI